MTTKDRNYDKELRRIAETLIDDVMSRSDEELLAEVKEAGAGLYSNVERVRGVIRRSISDGSKGKLAAARAALQQGQKRAQLRLVPASLDEKKRLLASILAGQAHTRLPFTLAARNADEASEADLDTMLQDLLDLGLIDEAGRPK
jgi:hypothetical protein